MKYDNHILFIPEKFDKERQDVLDTWISLGGVGFKVAKFWQEPIFDKKNKVVIYGNDTFALVLAQVLNVRLVTVDDTLIANFDIKWTKRKINITSLNKIEANVFPKFIKPVIPKQFKSKVYKDIQELIAETAGIAIEERIIISEIIQIEAELRSFVYNNKILDTAIYEGNADIAAAQYFLQEFIKSNSTKLPNTFVIDIGYNQLIGWFVIELNSSWAAGLNNCKATKVIDAIVSATVEL